MNYKSFSQLTLDFWDLYLRRISNLQKRGAIVRNIEGVKSPNDLVLLYPTILVCTQTDEYFITELVGNRPDFDHLILKKNRVPYINKYFYQFDIDASDPALLIDNKQYLKFENLCFSHEIDLDALHRRFPFLSNSDKPRIVYGSGKGAVIDIRNCSNFISFQNCTLVNGYSIAIRIKHLLQAIVIHQTTTPNKYSDYLRGFQNETNLYGIQYINSQDEEMYQVASQFATMYLSPGLRETTIGDFLNSHPNFIKTVFCTPRFEYEPYLEWQEGNPDMEEKAINPDLLIQRPDGYFDIYDLKLALLNRTKLTRGRRNRRRFIDYIAEGIAQLAHYANYFEFPQNRAYALEKYQVRVKDPRLVLIVGNIENLNRTEIDEASRVLKNIEIIDYDTILNLYLKR